MTNRFQIHTTPLEDLNVLERKPIGDHRGFLERMHCNADLEELLNGSTIVQINRTLTQQRGTVRGMHFQQPPHCEKKIISCLRGEIFDVAVDLRPDSETYLQWHGVTLSESNHLTFFIPEGFAHGFQTLTDDCELLYLHTAFYHAESEAGLDATDPDLAIDWPLELAQRSDRDNRLPKLDDGFNGIQL
ncbi:dTDP-4-dehydrorhamnose 3,5-epimerase [Rhodopirellula sp. P2]|uniref:dTDP-4-dehydrorhamnose 3,5-epimerase n=1 Tax=Rhodopirellula sp. P2 TaxID=2127060 RepID=UPI002368AD6B|nr:dTDP-4-dehydrorhamnose 3,5-epimerase [Rhodopirellula sp. P2]WDQ17425.1 dTDP-4-dehydrorhamnose 3,5-epimerase [Rhodopirellula sp. P2]